MAGTTIDSDSRARGQLRRSVGFYGLMFVSLGSIIGSGWLLGALNAAEVAGPASVLSWILAAVMLSMLALVYAELGATYPVAGGTGRFPYYSHGPIAGFMAGWASWLQAVFIAPIEVAGGHHLRQQRQLGQPALQHDPQGRRQRRPAERHRARRRAHR